MLIAKFIIGTHHCCLTFYLNFQQVIERMKANNDDDLAMFEKMWRQHFVDTMKPRFLPYMWSVDHNHKNVRARVAQGDTKFLKYRLDATEGKRDGQVANGENSLG